MKAVNVAITEELLLELLTLSGFYEIRNAEMSKAEAGVIIFTISGDDLPEVPEGGEPQRATIVCEKINSHIKVL